MFCSFRNSGALFLMFFVLFLGEVLFGLVCIFYFLFLFIVCLIWARPVG